MQFFKIKVKFLLTQKVHKSFNFSFFINSASVLSFLPHCLKSSKNKKNDIIIEILRDIQIQWVDNPIVSGAIPV